MLTPDLKSVVAMTIHNLNAVSELIADQDKPVHPKASKHARRAKALIVELIQQINDLSVAQKSTVTKKK